MSEISFKNHGQHFFHNLNLYRIRLNSFKNSFKYRFLKVQLLGKHLDSQKDELGSNPSQTCDNKSLRLKVKIYVSL